MKVRLNADFWRFIASFLVVAIHISPFEKINGELDFFFTAVIGRIAVPLFLMITGYFVLDKALEDTGVLVKYTKKIFIQYLFCVVIYLPINIYMKGFGFLEPQRFLHLLKAFFIDGTFYHLWYFPALILGIWLSFRLIKALGARGALAATAVLYLIGLFGDSYYGFIEGNEVLTGFYEGIFTVFDYTRNGLFYTPLFLCLGYFVKTGRKIGEYDLLYGFLMFLLMGAEGLMLHRMGVQRHTSMYLFLPLLMFFLFRAVVNRSEGESKRLREMGTGVYVFHPMVIVGVRFAAKLGKVEGVLVGDNLVFYLTVCGISAGVAWGAWELHKKIKEKEKEKGKGKKKK